MMKTRKFTLLQVLRNWIWGGFDKLVLWFSAKTFGYLVALMSLTSRYRMSHDNGVAAKGYLYIVKDPAFPAHGFFAPGTIYPVRIRHASADFLDDAMICIRSLSIKFSHDRFKSPFDLLMNTGEYSLFWSAASFLKFARFRREKYGVEYVEYFRKYPGGVKGAFNGVRRHVTSFQNLRYYGETPFLFIGKDGIKRYAKYRALPYENEEESGLPESDWDYVSERILPGEKNGRNYLKDEYEHRVKTQGAKYRLQIQTRIANDDDDPEVFNNMVLWDDRIFPWVDLAVMEINEVLDWKESTMTAFSVNNMPKTLGLLPAKSIFDYNSLNYLRKHSDIARKARWLSYRIFGMVPPVPYDDNRNTGTWSRGYN